MNECPQVAVERELLETRQYLEREIQDMRPLDPNGCAAQVGNWIAAGKYRSVIHRHSGLFVATDEAERRTTTASTLPLLADLLMNWPNDTEKY